MTGQPDGLRRRAYAALASCYAVACCLPAGLAQMMNYSRNPPGSTPGYSYVEGRRMSCKGDVGCPSEPVDISELLQVTSLVLAPSLLVAAPLCAYLARTWQMPILAGLISALVGWVALCVGGFLFLFLRS